MKKYLLYLTATFLTAHFTDAQVLYTENFNNLTVGNLCTDPTGVIPGQGGWKTKCFALPMYINNNYFEIVTEPGRGKVLKLTADQNVGVRAFINDLDLLWNNRNPGNNVCNIESDFFTGEHPAVPGYLPPYRRFNHTFGVSNTNIEYPSRTIIGMNHHQIMSSLILLIYNEGINHRVIPQSIINFPEKTWLKFEIHLNYPLQKAYFFIPTLDVYLETDQFLKLSTASNPMDDFTPTSFIIHIMGDEDIAKEVFVKYDNIIISAVDKAPLSVTELISSKFNIFPNPSNDVVTITNSENIGIEKVDVYDLTGRVIKTKEYNNENNVQLNLSDLATATYLLHIQNKEGVAVKKIVKK